MPALKNRAKRAFKQVQSGMKGFKKKVVKIAQFECEEDNSNNECVDLSTNEDANKEDETTALDDGGEKGGIKSVLDLRFVEGAGDEFRALYNGTSRATTYRNLDRKLAADSASYGSSKITDQFRKISAQYRDGIDKDVNVVEL